VVGVYANQPAPCPTLDHAFFAVIGYVLLKFDFRPSPAVDFSLTFIRIELRAPFTLSNGSFSTFFSSPLCWNLLAATALSMFVIPARKRKNKALQDVYDLNP
jgi:TctA family transporter